MKKLIIIAVTVVLWFNLMGVTVVKAGERRAHKECECIEVCVDGCKACDQCRDCIKRKRLNKRKKAAALEAQRRRNRIHMHRNQPRVVIGFNFPVYRYYYNGWGMRRSWRRPINVYINMGPRIGRLHHHHHPRRGR